MNFCIRNFICEHSQELPGIFENTVPGKKNKLPVFHIYGVTDTGKKACVHIHGALPYLILRVGSPISPVILMAMRAKINKCMQKEIEFSKGNAPKYQQDYVYKMEVFKSRSMYGYSENEEDFVRVFFSSPWYVQKAATALGKEADQKSMFQPFEAHLPFHLQFFIDNSIFGMDNIHLKKVKFRINSTDDDNSSLYKEIRISDVKNDPNLLSPYNRSTMCFIECDAHVSDILNVEMHKSNVHSSNPGLEYIWREEKARCDAENIELVDVFNSYEPRKTTKWPQEREMLRSARQIARKLRNSRNMPSSLDNLMDTLIADTPVASTSDSDRTIWESPDQEDNTEYRKTEDFEINADEEQDENRTDEEDEDPMEMTMIINETKPNMKKPTNEDEVSVISSDDEDERGEKLNWITGKSAFRQKFISKAENVFVDENKLQEARRTVSREMSSCSILTDDTILAARETQSRTIGPSKCMSQTSIEETIIDSEKSGESDIVGLCVASLELLIQTVRPFPDQTTDVILCASIAIFDDVCREAAPKVHRLFTMIPGTGMNSVECCENEEEIIQKIGDLVTKYDVDVLIGYDTARLSWGYLFRRAKSIGMDLRMDRIFMVVPNSEQYTNPKDEDDEMLPTVPKGRLLVSVWKMVRSDLTLRNYDLGSAVAQVLRRKLPMLDNASLTDRLTKEGSLACKPVFSHLLKLSKVNISLLSEMNWFLKNAEMARVYGIQFNEVWTRGSQLRVESMLLRLAHRLNFVAPSVTHAQRNTMSSPEQLQLILEPQSNVYFDPVIVLDFQSLYPSMVIAHNYCYSTILGKIANIGQTYDEAANFEEIVLGALKYRLDKESLVNLIAHKNVTASPLASLFVQKSKIEGILPLLLREILSARIMVKNAMKRIKSKKLKRILDARQLALKLVANVSYGYTAANWSGRMPCAELADAILGKGRETLERAIEMVTNGNYGGAEVIYGDTDSMFVLVKGAKVGEAFEIGKRIAEDVTNSNPDPVVLKLEKVYKSCVLETKKRYAGWMFEHENDEGKLDAKGIETVRRDTCPIVAEVLEKSLELIFNRRWRAFSSYLNKTVVSLPRMNFSKFVFCKEYRGDYSKVAMVPQKKIAEKRLKMCKNFVTLRGERVPYLIVDGSPGSTVYSCVRSIDEYSKNSNLKINVHYYLNSHILAALRRVTDLLPIKIELLPLYADQCYTLDCARLGQTPWCIECQKNEGELASAWVQFGRETRAIAQIREICSGCQSSEQMIEDFKISGCSNFSCLIRQTWTIIERENLSNIMQAHKLF